MQFLFLVSTKACQVSQQMLFMSADIVKHIHRYAIVTVSVHGRTLPGATTCSWKKRKNRKGNKDGGGGGVRGRGRRVQRHRAVPGEIHATNMALQWQRLMTKCSLMSTGPQGLQLSKHSTGETCLYSLNTGYCSCYRIPATAI